MFEKTENKLKRGRGWPIYKKDWPQLSQQVKENIVFRENIVRVKVDAPFESVFANCVRKVFVDSRHILLTT